MIDLIILGIGAYLLLAKEINKQVLSEEQELEKEIVEFKEKYEESRKELTQRISEAKNSLNFQLCTAAHHSSDKTARLAYSILERERRLKKIYLTGLDKINAELVKTIAERKKMKYGSPERNEKHTEYESGIKVKDGVIANIKSNQEKSDKISTEVDTLNLQTKELKELIRDNFGVGGKVWYERLEQRTAERKKK